MNPVIRYFSAEKAWCSGGAIIAILSVAVALWFFFRVRQPFQTGMAWPFLVLGIIFFIICLSVARRSDGDAARVEALISQNQPGLRSEELPRMTGVMRNFTIIISLEVVFLLTSISLLVWGNLSIAWRGAMTGLLIQAAWLFVFDMFARSRGGVYLNYLKTLAES